MGIQVVAATLAILVVLALKATQVVLARVTQVVRTSEAKNFAGQDVDRGGINRIKNIVDNKFL